MPKIIIKREGWKCFRCDHEWESKENNPKHEKPITCPNCRSPYWDIKRGNKK